MGMQELLVTLLVVFFTVSVAMGRTHDRKLHLWFPGHFSLAIVTTYISLRWFVTGQEFLFSYGQIWGIVERGSLDALSSTMGIVGVSCILLGWTYGDRDKVTLGKRQIDMIHHTLGYGYAVSLVTHFAATALCILMLKCTAREAALWAFATVLWGCIPQANICLCIALNRKNREQLALDLWKKECSEKDDKFEVIQNMAEHLNDVDARHNKEYRRAMGINITDWLHSCHENNSSDCGITVENIKIASRIYREVSERVPALDQELFEEDIMEAICAQLNVAEAKNEKALVLLCCGYYRYLYAQKPSELSSHINKIVYYSQKGDVTFKLFGELLQDFKYALEWYQFLNHRTGAPEYLATCSRRDPYIGIAFEHLILSIFENDGPSVQQNAKLAWNQVYPEVT